MSDVNGPVALITGASIPRRDSLENRLIGRNWVIHHVHTLSCHGTGKGRKEGARTPK
jgi:hypothetical protein